MVYQFPTSQRVAEIAMQMCRQHGYGLQTTHALTANAVRYAETHDCSAYEAARMAVRAPHEPMHGSVA